jgi:acetyltransferase-like isoleucine patch superfamily enzyme
MSSKWIKRSYYKYRGAEIGENTFLGPNVYLDVNHKPGKVVIGDNCFITRNCTVLVHSDVWMGGPLERWKDIGGERIFGDVTIEDNVFIGVHSVVMPGVTIGRNAVVGAMSLVTKDVPPNTIVGGVPAKEIGRVDDKIPALKNEC